MCTPFEKSLFLVGAYSGLGVYSGVGVYFGKYGALSLEKIKEVANCIDVFIRVRYIA